ncbi:MAG TPA: HAD family hydrolase [Candidatus Dormibacteraeota bacterium]|jgi:putative hydrolase of the HAD superfamily|nr:HAD family hydrolase [Candidatus Dormibacteraeota bacterium]
MLGAALVDVGGTLWPDRATTFPPPEDAVRRLSAVLPGTGAGLLERLRAALEEAVTAFAGELAQDNEGLVLEVAGRLGLPVTPPLAIAVRRAMSAPAAGLLGLFDGAEELLRALRALGLRTVIVSNAYWRDAEAYRRDFEDLGVAWLIDGIVSSVDVGRRKPDPAMFLAALPLAGCEAGDCVMIGNVEEKDVLPALCLGMRTIRVAPGAPCPPVSAAHASVTSLPAAAAALRDWARRG